MHFTAIAPAKIILTGEHSVVYGKPCIVTAVNRFAKTKIVPTLSSDICLTLFDFKQKASSTFKALSGLRDRLLESYRLCIKGELSIRQVLQKPAELFQFALISLFDTFQMEIQKGFNLDIRSDIPIGCGMGSSAATIVSVIGAVAKYLRIEVNMAWLHKLSMEVERMQHGFSSGVDSYVSLHGGCVRFQNGKVSHTKLGKFPFYIVNTGKPESSTGDCVMQVAKKFKTSSIWDEFEDVSSVLEKALLESDLFTVKECISYNQKLLEQIGTVPTKVSEFLKRLNVHGIAGKVCGAGAIFGDSAGILLTTDKPPKELCTEFGYTILEIAPELSGVRFA